MSWTFEATQAGYANLWKTATLKGGADARTPTPSPTRSLPAEQRYRTVQNGTGVPWYFIGALHMRESGCDFAGVLHNGEHIIGTGKVTTLVPAGRGPFATWEEAAIDALKMKDMQRVQSWSPARMLYQAEVYNGLGYVSRAKTRPTSGPAPITSRPASSWLMACSIRARTILSSASPRCLIRLAQKRADIHADLYPATPTGETRDRSRHPIPCPVDQDHRATVLHHDRLAGAVGLDAQ
jgi:lysozyme family protein